jgi:hypothetical protein
MNKNNGLLSHGNLVVKARFYRPERIQSGYKNKIPSFEPCFLGEKPPDPWYCIARTFFTFDIETSSLFTHKLRKRLPAVTGTVYQEMT